jgi:hypothetical protein
VKKKRKIILKHHTLWKTNDTIYLKLQNNMKRTVHLHVNVKLSIICACIDCKVIFFFINGKTLGDWKNDEKV